MPSASANTALPRTGTANRSNSISPAWIFSTRTAGRFAMPVTPCTPSTVDSVAGSARLSATSGASAELLAPVSSMKRKGPRPLISTGARIRPARSAVVGTA